MIFKEYLLAFQPQVREAIKELFKTAIGNQSHEADIFLISIHGFFHKAIEEARSQPGALNLSPYVFGPGTEAYQEEHASERFYKLIRNRIITGERKKFYDYKKSEEDWEITWSVQVQLEMYMYLKFWESDMVLKKLTQLARLANKEYYNWELTFSNRASSRGVHIEEFVLNKIEKICPKFHTLLLSIYDRHLRNTIAHSQYFFIGDNIILTQHPDKRYYTLEEWDILMNKFILFYDLLNHYVSLVESHFKKTKRDRHFGVQVRVIKKRRKRYPHYEWIRLQDDGDRWIWYRTWEQHYAHNFFII